MAEEPGSRDDRLAIDTENAPVTDSVMKRNAPWSYAEHLLYLLGLESHGRGAWRAISTDYCISRTPSQVASHAQKYFVRQELTAEQRQGRRPSIHDITREAIHPLATEGDRDKMRLALQAAIREGQDVVATGASTADSSVSSGNPSALSSALPIHDPLFSQVFALAIAPASSSQTGSTTGADTIHTNPQPLRYPAMYAQAMATQHMHAAAAAYAHGNNQWAMSPLAGHTFPQDTAHIPQHAGVPPQPLPVAYAADAHMHAQYFPPLLMLAPEASTPRGHLRPQQHQQRAHEPASGMHAFTPAAAAAVQPHAVNAPMYTWVAHPSPQASSVMPDGSQQQQVNAGTADAAAAAWHQPAVGWAWDASAAVPMRHLAAAWPGVNRVEPAAPAAPAPSHAHAMQPAHSLPLPMHSAAPWQPWQGPGSGEPDRGTKRDSGDFNKASCVNVHQAPALPPKVARGPVATGAASAPQFSMHGAAWPQPGLLPGHQLPPAPAWQPGAFTPWQSPATSFTAPTTTSPLQTDYRPAAHSDQDRHPEIMRQTTPMGVDYGSVAALTEETGAPTQRDPPEPESLDLTPLALLPTPDPPRAFRHRRRRRGVASGDTRGLKIAQSSRLFAPAGAPQPEMPGASHGVDQPRIVAVAPAPPDDDANARVALPAAAGQEPRRRQSEEGVPVDNALVVRDLGAGTVPDMADVDDLVGYLFNHRSDLGDGLGVGALSWDKPGSGSGSTTSGSGSGSHNNAARNGVDQ